MCFPQSLHFQSPSLNLIVVSLGAIVVVDVISIMLSFNALFGFKSMGLSGLLVMGDMDLVFNHVSIASFSYEIPSLSTTGSFITSPVIGQ